MISTSSRKSKRKLLVISCTATKRNLRNAPALEVYDGPMFRILRKHLEGGLTTKIISAKYGFIDAKDRISTYEMKMTLDRTKELREYVTKSLENTLKSGNYDEVFLELGSVYQKTIDIDVKDFPRTKFILDSGTIGTRQHNLKTWLEQN